MRFKPEIRRPKAEHLPVGPNRNPESRFRVSDFGFLSGFGFRISSFPTLRAFTLIEVTLALAVSAIVLAAISGVFYSAIRLRERTMAMVDEAAPLQQTANFLRHDLKGAVAPGGTIAGALQSGVVGGNFGQNDGIEIFTTTGSLSESGPWADVQKVTYQLQEAPGATRGAGRDLVRSVTRNLLSTTVEEADDQWLLGNVQDLQFSYYDGTVWQDAWNATMGQTNLPTAVRVRITPVADQSAGTAKIEPYEFVFPLVAQTRTNSTQTATQ